MAIINLRDYYPFYTSDYFMEVPEDVVEMFKEFDRKEAAYRRKGQILRPTPNTAPLICGACYNTQPEDLLTMA